MSLPARLRRVGRGDRGLAIRRLFTNYFCDEDQDSQKKEIRQCGCVESMVNVNSRFGNTS
jgi:hypothetical protein